MREKVSLLGTLNFHQSTTAAAIMPTQIVRTGQFCQVSRLMGMSFAGIRSCRGETFGARSAAGPWPRAALRAQHAVAQLPVPPMVLLTLVNVLLAFEPRAVIAVMHTTTMRASITAYSTAVGPS